jgi:hypothetical protein
MAARHDSDDLLWASSVVSESDLVRVISSFGGRARCAFSESELRENAFWVSVSA